MDISIQRLCIAKSLVNEDYSKVAIIDDRHGRKMFLLDDDVKEGDYALEVFNPQTNEFKVYSLHTSYMFTYYSRSTFKRALGQAIANVGLHAVNVGLFYMLNGRARLHRSVLDVDWERVSTDNVWVLNKTTVNNEGDLPPLSIEVPEFTGTYRNPFEPLRK